MVKELYTPGDIADIDYPNDLGDPGEYPFTRGIHSNMYRGRLWTMRELTGYGTPEDTAERVKLLIAEGTTGLNVICDLPTYYGIDADHPLAEGQIGGVGIPLSSLKDMEAFSESIPLDKVNFSIVISTCPAIIVLAQYIVAAEKRGIDISKLRGTIQNEPIKGRYCGYEPGSKYMDLCLKTCGDIIEYCVKNMPLWNPINVNTYDFGNFFITGAQEIAIGISIAVAHIEEALRRGLNIDGVAPRMAFYCGTDVRLFEEVAKLRAARRLWAKIIGERFHARDPRSMRFRFGIHTAGYSLVPQEPLNNVTRLAMQSLAAVLAGCQSLEGTCYDEPIALPTEESHRISLRIQQILAHETGVADVADPLGGSYYMEYLTNRIEKEASEILSNLDDMGGIVGAIDSKWLDGELERTVLQHQRRIQSREQIVVGSNAFTTPDEQQRIVPAYRIPPDAARRQLERLKEVKQTRDSVKVRQTLSVLYSKAEKKDGENLMPYIIETVKSYATTGEIFGTIQQAYGYPYDSMGVIESPFNFQG